MSICCKRRNIFLPKISLFLGLASLVLSACAIQGLPQPTVDVEATVAAAVEATMTAERASATQSAGRDSADDAAVASENAESGGETPMLITPMPDRSAEISQFVVANTRRFRGNPDAPVVLIEFSDFQ